jgi:drug/metabolite transporter (DMT)-like permease
MGVLVIFELLTAVVSAMVVGGERLDGSGWTGAALIVAAALIEARAGNRPPSPTRPQALTPESP